MYEIKKRCFICASVEDDNGCTNKNCPRYNIKKETTTENTNSTTSTTK